MSTVITTRVDVDIVNTLNQSKVTVVGVGSVGSYVAEQLVRTGVRNLTLVDHDIVSSANLSRTPFVTSDIGHNKVSALSSRLSAITDCHVTTYSSKLDEIDTEALRTIFDESDLIVAATDDPETQSAINRLSHHADVAVVYIGLYQAALGGEVIMTVPGLTPCYSCQTGGRRNVINREDDRHLDYGTHRLKGVVALGCDIQYVSAAGVRLCVGLLCALGEENNSALSNFMLNALSKGCSYLTSSMSDTGPLAPLYDQIFERTPGQFAFQSAWITASASETCNVCGNAESGEDPFTYYKPTPHVSKFLLHT